MPKWDVTTPTVADNSDSAITLTGTTTDVAGLAKDSRNWLPLRGGDQQDGLPRYHGLASGVGGGGVGGYGGASVTGLSAASARSLIQGSVITFQDVQYVVPVRKNPCVKAVKKVVLDRVR